MFSLQLQHLSFIQISSFPNTLRYKLSIKVNITIYCNLMFFSRHCPSILTTCLYSKTKLYIICSYRLRWFHYWFHVPWVLVDYQQLKLLTRNQQSHIYFWSDMVILSSPYLFLRSCGISLVLDLVSIKA